MDFEKLKQKYENKLEALAAFPVWTVEQIKEILNLDFNTIQRFVTAGWLCKFTVSRCTFYSTEKKQYNNQTIIKTVMSIDAHYYVTFNCYADILRLDSTLDDKSLIARNVKKIGWLDNERQFHLYHALMIYPMSAKDFAKVEKLLIDIHNNNPSDYIFVAILIHDTDAAALAEFLENSEKLLLYRMCNYICYKVIPLQRSCYKYLRT